MTNPLYDSLFAIHAGNTGHFINNPLSGDTLSYDGFLQQTGQCANALRSMGIEKGDRVIAQVGKSVSALVLYAGCIQAGVVYLPLNTAYTQNEVEYFVADSGAKLMVCDQGSENSYATIAESFATKMLTQSADGLTGSLIDLMNASSPEFETTDCSLDDLAALLYTSGTTGRSKGAMITQQNLLSNAKTLKEHWQFTENDVLLHALPVFHTHGLFVATNVCLLSGAQIIFEPKFKIDRIIELMPYATTLMGVPTFYTRLLDEPQFSKVLTKNMRLFISGSAPLLADTHKQFTQRTGHNILERYGMTETNMNTSNPYDGERRPGTVGFALPGIEVKITDAESGDAVPNGEIGQLEVRGPNVFKGYWKMPEKTAEEIREDGFFITGDLAQIDADGYIHIVGRDKDLIISGGLNIYPKEIELILDQMPGIVESAVVGIPHPDFGESVVAVLVGEKNEIDLVAVEAGIAESLASFKRPRKFIVVESLPRNAMGKVQKNELRSEFATLLSEAK